MTKVKYPAAAAKAVARELCGLLQLCCEPNIAEKRPYLVVAGSLRRRKSEVGDVELLCVPRIGQVPDGLFTRQGSLVDHRLDELIAQKVIAMRTNTNGSVMWGPKNKLAVHVASGIPVDVFITNRRAWFNYLVCRTGSGQNNTRIATAARARGLMWHPYDEGFEVINAREASKILNRELRPRQMLQVSSEEDVFTISGLPFLTPEQR